MNRLCFFSSFVFLTNVINNFFHCDYIYSGLFLTLFFTSILHHYYCETWTNYLDKMPIVAIISYGGMLYYKKLRENLNGSSNVSIAFVPVICFYLTVFLYLYGDITDQYCFHKDDKIANTYHALMHFVSSIGHHAIMVL